jgi:hypothetical protein
VHDRTLDVSLRSYDENFLLLRWREEVVQRGRALSGGDPVTRQDQGSKFIEPRQSPGDPRPIDARRHLLPRAGVKGSAHNGA